METRVHTPQQVFNMPQRLLVPLFQRPYVWNEENQWAPLWADVTRVADRRLSKPDAKQFAHFLGAVVLQQATGGVGSMQQWMVIDGQQRLTTLQIMLDALHAELTAIGAAQPARRIETLVANDDAYWSQPEDRFKVWPTNRDRAAFNEVMGAAPPVDYSKLGYRGERLVQAHQFFADQARSWLHLNGPEDTAIRAVALEQTVRELLQVVVIELTAEENAQEIFETLNARGAQLTAADLIKNFVFQRLMESGADVEAIYEKQWAEFETAFWEAEIGAGRVRHSRSSLFLNHWLISRTGEEIVAREVFNRFKQFCDHDVELPIHQVIDQIAEASRVYRRFVESAAAGDRAVDRVGLFAYRSGVLENEVVKPVVLALLDPSLPAVPQAQIEKGVAALESWLVRRMLIRASTKAYNKLSADVVTQMFKSDRANAGDVIHNFLKGQGVESAYWPDDNEVRTELRYMPAYRKLRQPRLRMVLEAIEDHRRGWIGDKEGLGGSRVVRGKFAIEHVLPRQWERHWPSESTENTADREALVHTLGNLTLLTGRLNSSISNGPWDQKAAALREHDTLKLNMDLLASVSNDWSHEDIRNRTEEMITAILQIWPVPEGHVSAFARTVERPQNKVQVADLLGAGLLEPGQTLTPSQKKYESRVVTVLSDGRLEIDGRAFGSPSGAASHIAGGSRNGWGFFWVDSVTKRKLDDLWREYVDLTSAEADESELDLDEVDDDSES
jgi:hypothetical protein